LDVPVSNMPWALSGKINVAISTNEQAIGGDNI
jgi:hypothetical protein